MHPLMSIVERLSLLIADWGRNANAECWLIVDGHEIVEPKPVPDMRGNMMPALSHPGSGLGIIWADEGNLEAN